MKITRDNYEVAFIDYFDGSLDAAAVAELRAFLDANPDLKAEFDSFSVQPLVAEDVIFEDKAALKRGSITEHNIQSYLNAEVNQDLTAVEQQQLNTFLENHPAFHQDRGLYSKTILRPDLSIVFPDKKKLKQPVPIAFNTTLVRYAVAAMLLLSLLAGSVYLFNKSANKSDRQVAEAPVNSSVDNTDASGPTSSANADKKSVATDPTVSSGLNQEAATQNNQPSPRNHGKSVIHLNKVTQQQLPILAQKVMPSVAPAQNQPHENSVEMVPVLSASLHPVVQPVQQPVANPVVTNQSSPAVAPEYLTVWEALRKAGDSNLKKITGSEGETLALADDAASDRLKVREVVEKGIEKISGDKIRLDAGDNEQRNSFRFAIGNFSIEKN